MASTGAKKLIPGVKVRTTYKSQPVDIPADFLTTYPADAEPMTVKVIDWTKTPLPQYEGLHAVVMDCVLSPSECETLLRLGEASVADVPKGDDPWQPALVNVGDGFEVLAPEYRKGDRIIWDSPEVCSRLWNRIQAGLAAEAPKTLEKLQVVQGEDMALLKKGRFELRRLNERMRYLRYYAGGFFRGKSLIRPGRRRDS